MDRRTEVPFLTHSVYTPLPIQSVSVSPRVGFGAHVCDHCRISPPRFLAECRKRRLNQGSLFFAVFLGCLLCLICI